MIDFDTIIAGVQAFNDTIPHPDQPGDTHQSVRRRMLAEGVDPDGVGRYVALQINAVSERINAGEHYTEAFARALFTTAAVFTYLANSNTGGHDDVPRRDDEPA